MTAMNSATKTWTDYEKTWDSNTTGPGKLWALEEWGNYILAHPGSYSWDEISSFARALVETVYISETWEADKDGNPIPIIDTET